MIHTFPNGDPVPRDYPIHMPSGPYDDEPRWHDDKGLTERAYAALFCIAVACIIGGCAAWAVW